MSYVELPVDSHLIPWVAAHWRFRVDPDAGSIEHTVPLTGGAMLVARRGAEPLLAGPRVSPLTTIVRGGDEVWGSHLWPGAAAALFRTSGEALRDQVVPLRVLMGDEAAATLTAAMKDVTDEPRGCRALDHVVRELASTSAPLDDAVMTAVARIVSSDGRATVAALARELGISARQLRRRFRRAVGVTAKELARIRRVRASAIDLVREPGRRWAEIAAQHGYADQAHLVREYRSLLGLTPTGFDGHVRKIRHGRVES